MGYEMKVSRIAHHTSRILSPNADDSAPRFKLMEAKRGRGPQPKRKSPADRRTQLSMLFVGFLYQLEKIFALFAKISLVTE
jgi:hypothetical protein